MRDADHQDRDPLILDPGDYAVIADAPAPVAGMLADQRAADRARVVKGGDALFERLDDPRGHFAIELAQFLRGRRQELNRPGQARLSNR